MKKCNQTKCDSHWDSHHAEEWLFGEDDVETTQHEKRAIGIADKSNNNICEPKRKLDDAIGKNISGLKNGSLEGQNNDTQYHGVTNVGADTHSTVGAVGAVGIEEITDLPRVLDYVNIKYGTSRTQLRNLSEKGCYDTILVDSSGVGSGPNIKCPVEAHVYLPTPNHKTCEPSVTAIRVSCDVKPVSEENLNYGTKVKPVYERGEETKPVSTRSLQFESRFESGNLMQAFEL